MNETTTSATAWTLPLGRPFGIPLRLHVTFLLLVVWFALDARRVGHAPALAVAFLLLLFTCVVLHELGHALAARRFGVRTREIVLYPIGGLARLERMPAGSAELWIALAGPAVNLVLFAVLLPLALRGGPPPTGRLTTPADLLFWLPFVNLMLFAFNLIPAFPMDGGRVLRAALSLRMPLERATAIAAGIGQGIAILFAVAGLATGNVVLVLIALFVYIGAAQEAGAQRRSIAVRGRSADEAMITVFERLAPEDSLGRAAERLLATHQQDFPVIDAWGRAVGVLSRAALLRALASHDASRPVLEVMDRDLVRVSPDTSLDQVLAALRLRPDLPLIVVDGDRVTGMITLENLAEFIEVARASRRVE